MLVTFKTIMNISKKGDIFKKSWKYLKKLWYIQQMGNVHHSCMYSKIYYIKKYWIYLKRLNTSKKGLKISEETSIYLKKSEISKKKLGMSKNMLVRFKDCWIYLKRSWISPKKDWK